MENRADETEPVRLFGRASILAAGTAYQQCLSFVSGLVVARVIGAAEYGVFNLARSLGLDLPLARATKDQYDRMVAEGLGELDKSGIAELTFKDRSAARQKAAD